MKKQIVWLAVLLLSAGGATDGFAQSGVKYPYVTSEGSTSGTTSVIVSRDSNGGVKTSCIHANWKASTMPAHKENEAANAVSARFEVASADLSGEKSWGDAKSGCASYTQTGTSAGDWRLPTQREIMLIYVMRKQQGFLSSSWTTLLYWSGTDTIDDTTTATGRSKWWYVGFHSGHVTNYFDSALNQVRCVRDF